MEILEPKPTATSHLREKKCGLNCIPKKCYTWNKACKLDHSGDCHHSLPLSSWHHQQLTYLHGHLPCHSLTLSWDPWPLYRQITVNPKTQKKISPTLCHCIKRTPSSDALLKRSVKFISVLFTSEALRRSHHPFPQDHGIVAAKGTLIPLISPPLVKLVVTMPSKISPYQGFKQLHCVSLSKAAWKTIISNFRGLKMVEEWRNQLGENCTHHLHGLSAAWSGLLKGLFMSTVFTDSSFSTCRFSETCYVKKGLLDILPHQLMLGKHQPCQSLTSKKWSGK